MNRAPRKFDVFADGAQSPGARRLDIAIVGHVDHGKSTLVGRLLHDTGTLPDGKVAAVQDLITVDTALAAECEYALHLGLTEAGMGSKGIVASTAALAVLLQQGIGATIRISLTPAPRGDRTHEVVVAQEILQTMGFRSFVPLVTACPGCGRTTSTVFQSLAERIQGYVWDKMPEWRDRYVGVEAMNLAVMGCIVNGPGESKHADIGISLPGSGERPVAPVYEDGKKTVTLRGDDISKQFINLLETYIDTRYRKEG